MTSIPFAQPQSDACACGSPATLFVHGSHIAEDVCQTCFTHFYLSNEDDHRAWVADPIAAPHAITRQSEAIEQTMQRNRICPTCQDAHYGWQCPDIGDVLSGVAVYDTTEMARLWAASRTLLAAKLARLTGPQLACQAIDFAAWLNERTRANLPALSVLRIWEQFIADGGDRGSARPAREALIG